MNFDFLEEFQDAYLQTEQGRGVFLAGVVLGYVARYQVSTEKEIKNAPLFKQIQFGRMDMRSLKHLLARVPTLLKAYSENIKAFDLVNRLNKKVGAMILADASKDLGVEGNFAFTVGFSNSVEIFWKIFKKEEKED